MQCSRCERLPDTPSGTGKIFLSSPLKHTLTKLANLMEKHDFPYEMKDGEILYSRISTETLERLAGVIDEQLSNEEIKDVKALWKQSGNELTLTDLTEMKPLGTFLGQIQSKWLVEVLKDERLFNVYQPIVNANDPDSTHGYECLLRARDRNGQSISPGKIFESARKSNLLFQLDRDARIAAVRNSSRKGIPEKIFINFMPTSIYDPEYCLQTTMNALAQSNLNPDQLVFEVVETEEIGDRQNLVDIFDHYRQEGIDVALDDLGSGYSSLNVLKELQPDYVKLDLELVQSVQEHSLQSELASSLIDAAQSEGIKTIAEGIETKEEYEWFQNQGTDYLQGFYFAKPSENPKQGKLTGDNSN